MAANLDKNFWYQITLKSSDALSLASSGLAKSGTGSAFFQNTNKTSPHQLWQLWSAENGTYVLRSQESGPDGYLTVHVGKEDTKGENTGNTTPIISVYTLADESMYWTISPWGDGSSFMNNEANGTAWNLEKEANGLMTMSSNKTAPQVGQHFVFQPLKKIDDTKYSTLQTATSAPTAAPTSDPTATPIPGTSSPTTPDTSSGLSTGAKAGIGAGVGILALLALVAGILFLMRRRKQKSTQGSTFSQSEKKRSDVPGQGANTSYEEYAELPAVNASHAAPIELEGEGHRGLKVERPKQEPVQLP